ncbi:MAG: anhydro-N-acetylmuramic acid kinase [Nitrospirae bacterium YQR-1]
MLNMGGSGSKKIIGLMSGTSHDGVDAAVVEITDTAGDNALKTDLLYHIHKKYPEKLRIKIRAAFSGNTETICRLNFELGEFFALCVNQLIAGCGIKKDDIAVVASHGQTIYHIPPIGGKGGSTLQIGESSIIAARTGLAVVSDFRPKDMAYGGQGAPLVPIADYLLFSKPGVVRAVVNIGGMANATILNGNIENTVAFDTGPGNSLIDEMIVLKTNGKLSFDNGGGIARNGTPDKRLLSELLSHPYLRKKPPKSTGRETFGRALSENICNRYRDLRYDDLISTLTHFTAKTIFNSIKPYRPVEVIVTGGGVRNEFLMELISSMFLPEGADVKNISEYGIPPEAKEAVSFAIIGYRTLKGLPGNVPSATGALSGTILGKLTLP